MPRNTALLLRQMPHKSLSPGTEPQSPRLQGEEGGRKKLKVRALEGIKAMAVSQNGTVVPSLRHSCKYARTQPMNISFINSSRI